MKPENTNFLQPTKFLMTFPEITDAVYFCQKANIPGVSLDSPVHVTPNLDLYVSGTKITYNTFDMDFLVNEDISAWLEMYRWLVELSSIEKSYNMRKNKQSTLTIMSNQNNPKMRVNFINIFPVSISSLDFDTTLSADEHIMASASFRYDYYTIEKVS
jgi:hypothetical protein